MSNKLKFANTGPQLAHIIKDHPRWTAIAEAVRNMIEASTSYYKKGEPIELKIRKLDIAAGLIGYEESNGAVVDRFKDKLSFLNPGGMTATELDTAFCQIGSSIGKVNSIDRNYGQGIRTATLFWTDLLCITYKKDTDLAHFVWLGKEDLTGNDFTIDIKSSEGVDNVQECTDWVKANAVAREYNLEEDFTEVIFLGKDADPTQDTFVNPYGKDSSPSALWIRKALYTRFWKLPQNVKLLLSMNVLKKETSAMGYREFMTFMECLDYDNKNIKERPRVDIIKSATSGARIHYIHDVQVEQDREKPGPYSTAKANDNGWSGGNVSGIIMGNEMYNVKSESAQEQSALIKIGIQQNFRNFKIMYELPANAGYTYDMYRTTVLQGQDAVLFDDEEVLQDIVDCMPEWFKKLVESTKMHTRKDLNSEIINRLQLQKNLLNPLKGLTQKIKRKTRTPNDVDDDDTNKKRRRPFIKNRSGDKKQGDPAIPAIVPNPSVTEPYFAKVEGTMQNTTVFTNPEWKNLETLATDIDPDKDKGRWYLRAKVLLEQEFTICAVIWYLNALSENLKDNITADEYKDTIKPRSINMYLMAIQTSIYDTVKRQVLKEYKDDARAIKMSGDADPEVLTNGKSALDEKFVKAGGTLPTANGQVGTMVYQDPTIK